MGAISFNNKLYPVGGTPAANMSVYDNSDSGLEATNVQDAIDELAEGGGGGGGHTIIDDTGTAVAQRSKLQFGDYNLIDDSENDITKVDLVKPEEVTWANYQQLTPVQKAGKQFYVPDYPSIGGVFFFQTEAAMQAAEATLPDNAVCIVWEDDPYVVTADVVEYDNTDSGLTADNIQDAVDEVVEDVGNLNAASLTYDNSTTGLPANVQGAIDKTTGNISSLGTVELTSTAAHAHAVRSTFLWIGQLVKATVAIAVGDTIALGTNVENTDICSALDELRRKSKWLYLGSSSIGSPLSLNLDNYDELCIIGSPIHAQDPHAYVCSITIPMIDVLTRGSSNFAMGFGGTLNTSSPNGARIYLGVTRTTIVIHNAIYDGANQTTATVYVYGKLD